MAIKIYKPTSAGRRLHSVTDYSVLHKKAKILGVSASTFGLLDYQKSSGGLIGSLSLRPWQEALRDYLKTEWV